MRKFLTVIATTLLLFAGAGIANATGSNPDPKPLGAISYAYTSTLTIVDDATGAETTTTEHHSGLSGPTNGQSSLASGGDLVVHCNAYYSPTDGNGTFTIQHPCGGTTAAWSFKASPTACANAVGLAYEAGMSWEYNGIVKPRQAPHTQDCRYLFHGTFNPATDYSLITYQDSITYKIVIGNHSGSAYLQIAGKLNILGSPCSPTNC